MLRSLLALLLLPVLAHAEPWVSFTQEVSPILTRVGCNSGACHGTPTGKGGFRLSLRGYDPTLDVASLKRDANGRRIDRLAPDASLILLKGAGRIPHEGGVRLEASRPEYALVRQWIEQGALIDTASAPALNRLEITPAKIVLPHSTETTSVRVFAHLADGSRRDVTGLSRFSVNDELQVRVSADGVVTRLRTGEVAVAAEYRSQMITALVTFLPQEPTTKWERPSAVNFIDTHVLNKLELLRMQPSALCDDSTFLRRVYLDVTGQLPTTDTIRAFLADTRADKRSRAIQSALESDAYADYWAMKWTDRLGCNQRFVGKIGAEKFHAWIRQQIAANVPEDEFVRTILTASGPNYSMPAVGFHRRLKDPEKAAEEIAQLFLGVRMQCAKCHNHPGERWTQDDYYGLAAFFAQQKFRDGPFFEGVYNKEETLIIDRSQQLKHPRTGVATPPKVLGESPPNISPHQDRRDWFADWLTADDNPFFAKASVNRIWFHLMGRGIVEPVDDIRSTNPPANAELLDALTAEFIRSGYDRKHLIRVILTSRTYQQAASATETNGDDEKYFARARLRLLGAEQLLDAISQSTGVAEVFKSQPMGLRAVQLPDGETRHPFLEAFGRPARAMTCECERGSDTTLSQALHLTGGATVQAKLRSEKGRIADWLKQKLSDNQLVDEAFLATLSRRPTEEEKAVVLPMLAQLTDQTRRGVVEDLLWALINHREYVFQR